MPQGLGTVFHLWPSASLSVKIGVVSTSVVCYKVGASICQLYETQVMEVIISYEDSRYHPHSEFYPLHCRWGSVLIWGFRNNH